MMKPLGRFLSRFRSLAAPAMLAAVLSLAWGCDARAAAADGVMRAVLLGNDLGDPTNPANAKIALTMPQSLLRPGDSVTADDFRIYVHPAGMPREKGLSDDYLASGVYLWRSGDKIFLDARALHDRNEEGAATVRVVYAPSGAVAAETVAEGAGRFTSDFVDVVLAVDVSLSMNHNDPKKRRVAAARTFIEMAEKGGGVGRVALVTFNHNASLGSPLIPLERGEVLLGALNRIGAGGLTNLDKPLAIALRELRGSRNPVIILLTDGKNEGHRYEETHLEAARAGVRVFSVGLSEQADHNLLRAMAEATGGIYFRAVTDADLPEIYARLAAELGKRHLLHSERLPTPNGELAVPIDGTVKRLVALADGGARISVDGSGAGVFTDKAKSSVYMGSPKPGEWNFGWEQATPRVSRLGLFGDTRFFLEVFPPQLRFEHLAVGATLAQGELPLAGAEVWAEPIPGVTDSRIRLYDDGNHGDGDANDGVYGAMLRLPNPADRFDLTVRASGRAWGEGGFVRQAEETAVQSGEEPPGRASLDGDVDFGVLFPGETGTALARIDLDSRLPRELGMDLQWQNGASEWPDLSSRITVEPGRHAFELEMTVPADSLPGDYSGSFTVGDGGDLKGSAAARVRVGGVRFGHGGAVDLGDVPPGTFVSRVLNFTYDADKAAPLVMSVEGGEDLSVTGAPGRLDARSGAITLEAVVSAPMGKPEGEYQGRITLRAGPGVAEIPLRWRVKSYSAVSKAIVPVPGLPAPPELAPEAAPLQQTPGLTSDLWQPQVSGHSRDPLESPLEKAERIFREQQRVTGVTDAPASVTVPSIVVPKTDGSSFWSAWWLYILAALLLLLLLLLLLAYILYRLGKSALARLLLVSALANALLLALFILLLGAASSMAASQPKTISVSLVENDLGDVIQFTDTEKELLASTGDSSASAAGGGAAAVGEASISQSAPSGGGGGGLVSEKASTLPDSGPQDAQLADSAQPSSMPMEARTEETMRRRERLRERDQSQNAPEHELVEMQEPATNTESSGQRGGTSAEVGEARLDIDMAEDSERPVWSDGDRPVQPVANEQGVLLADISGMEKVTLDPTVRRVDPRGRMRNTREISDVEPEPRQDVADPSRDKSEFASPEAPNLLQDDPGVEEVRIQARAMGADYIGEKPGLILTPGVSNLSASVPSTMPSGVSRTVEVDRAAPRGGRSTSRGTIGRAGSAMPEAASSLPGGGSSGSGDAGARQGASGRTGSGSGSSAAAGEKRFDDGPSGGGGGADGLTGSSGGPRSPEGIGGSGGAAPNPFAGGGNGAGGEGPAEFSQPGGGGGAGLPGLRGRQRNGEGAGEGPEGLAGVPGGSSSGPGGSSPGDGTPGGAGPGGDRGTGGKGGDGGNSSGRSRGDGLGEGRFDDMTGFGSGGGSRARDGLRGGSLGSSDIGGDGDTAGLGIIPIQTEDAEWRRNERRRPQRVVNVAASVVDMDSLLIVVGDFARTPDAASRNLFADLAANLGKGLTVEERVLSPMDTNLSDCLLAVLTPDEVRDWSDTAVGRVADYLKAGGHIWMDAGRPAQAKPFMDRLARAAGGSFASLDERHQLAEDEIVDALTIGDKLAAVVTYQDWRKDWRHGAGGDRTMRFLKRTLNYFLSGNADSGISLEPGQIRSGLHIEPSREVMPELLAGGVGEGGRLWDEFGPDSAANWRMPSWSDRGSVSAISDGEGGRALKMDLASASKGRAAVYRTLNPVQDFSGVDHIVLDAYYDGDGEASLSMVFTVDAGTGWVDYESGSLPLLRGWNRLRFNLADRTYRMLSGEGGSGQALPTAGRTGRAGFFLYRDSDSPAVSLFRDIRLYDK